MKITNSLFLFSAVFFFCCTHAQKNERGLKLWYDKPAFIWEEALPLGNAKTGAMVFGGIATEHFQLNDNTLWSGYPNAGNNPNGPKILPQVRTQILAGNWDSATSLWKKMQGPYSARYLPLADLWLKNNLKDSVASFYYRDLDLNNATSTVKYTINSVTYQRETFISHPDKIMIVRITASKKGALNFNTSLTSKLKFITEAFSFPVGGSREGARRRRVSDRANGRYRHLIVTSMYTVRRLAQRSCNRYDWRHGKSSGCPPSPACVDGGRAERRLVWPCADRSRSTTWRSVAP